MDEASDSVTEWIKLCETGDQAAATALWDRYFQELVLLSRKRLSPTSTAAFDEEDLAIGVLASFFVGVKNGRLAATNRQHLWQVLQCIAKRSAVDQIRRNTRLKRREQGYGAGVSVERISREAAPELQLELDDEFNYLLDKLPNQEYRRIVELRLKGVDNSQIANELGKSLRSVERKVKVIKQLWFEELAGV